MENVHVFSNATKKSYFKEEKKHMHEEKYGAFREDATDVDDVIEPYEEVIDDE